MLSRGGAKPLFGLLLDPEKYSTEAIEKISIQSASYGVDLILVGGSLVQSDMGQAIQSIRQSCNLPVILFPGHPLQFVATADALLMLSLISGRNPEHLIGNHVQIAAAVKRSGMEVIPTGYMLVDGGAPTSVQYVSNTMPIPWQKNDIAVATAMAGELLGLRLIYLEAGSGAKQPVHPSMVRAVTEGVGIPVAVGGGIRTPAQVKDAANSGASMVVVGNAVEVSPKELPALVDACKG